MTKKVKYVLYGFLGVAFAFGFTFFSSTQKVKPLQPVPKASVLQQRAFLQTTTIYSLCGHSSTSKKVIPKELVNLSEKAVKELHPEWEIISFEPELLSIRIKLNALDEQCANRKYLSLSDGRVAIFRGIPGRGVVEKITGIHAENLPASEVESLKVGLEVASEGELLEILEGLAEGEEDGEFE